MALRSLSVEEMEQVSGAWLDANNEAHEAFMRIELLKGLVEPLREAHEGLLAVTPTKSNPRLQEIMVLASELDEMHDRIARGVHGFLTESALIGGDGERLLKLRDQLFPDGLGPAIHNTYRGQAGFAALLRRRLTDEVEGQLRELALYNGKSLFEQVEAWLDAGDELGDLEEERARLEKEATPSFAGQVHEARNAWIRVVNVVVATAELRDFEEGTDRLLFGPLRDAEAKAELRAARRKADDPPESTTSATGSTA